MNFQDYKDNATKIASKYVADMTDEIVTGCYIMCDDGDHHIAVKVQSFQRVRVVEIRTDTKSVSMYELADHRGMEFIRWNE